ncbi:MAG: hypothetical protein KUG74_10825 [Rhodobacteraceae bacterium]|nr:hypothetical protein [Paracoccaceae bacterium]
MTTLTSRPRTGSFAKARTQRAQRPGRAPFEFYPTPPEATRALLSVESFDGPIWEPACGDGAISRELTAAGYSVTSTDLIDRGFGTGGQNFLKSDKPLAKHIITNPPYGTHGLGDAFVRRALIHCKKPVDLWLCCSIFARWPTLTDMPSSPKLHPQRSTFWTI